MKKEYVIPQVSELDLHFENMVLTGSNEEPGETINVYTIEQSSP